MPRPMSPTHTFRFKPNGQIPFENAAQPELHQPTSQLKLSQPTSQQGPFNIHPKQDSTSPHFKQNSKHIRNPI